MMVMMMMNGGNMLIHSLDGIQNVYMMIVCQFESKKDASKTAYFSCKIYFGLYSFSSANIEIRERSSHLGIIFGSR